MSAQHDEIHALDPIVDCVCCGDDAEIVGAPGPGEPVDEYICNGCGCNFLADGTITYAADACTSGDES